MKHNRFVFLAAVAGSALLAAAPASAAHLYRLSMDQRAVTMQDCKVVPGRPEPAAELTIKVRGRSSVKAAYSDICVPSAQWYTEVFIDADSAIVGLATGQPGGTDGGVVISEFWRKR